MEFIKKSVLLTALTLLAAVGCGRVEGTATKLVKGNTTVNLIVVDPKSTLTIDDSLFNNPSTTAVLVENYTQKIERPKDITQTVDLGVNFNKSMDYLPETETLCNSLKQIYTKCEKKGITPQYLESRHPICFTPRQEESMQQNNALWNKLVGHICLEISALLSSLKESCTTNPVASTLLATISTKQYCAQALAAVQKIKTENEQKEKRKLEQNKKKQTQTVGAKKAPTKKSTPKVTPPAKTTAIKRGTLYSVVHSDAYTKVGKNITPQEGLATKYKTLKKEIIKETHDLSLVNMLLEIDKAEKDGKTNIVIYIIKKNNMTDPIALLNKAGFNKPEEPKLVALENLPATNTQPTNSAPTQASEPAPKTTPFLTKKRILWGLGICAIVAVAAVAAYKNRAKLFSWFFSSPKPHSAFAPAELRPTQSAYTPAPAPVVIQEPIQETVVDQPTGREIYVHAVSPR